MRPSTLRFKPIKVRAVVDGRTFYVSFDQDGEPVRIYERKCSDKWQNVRYWNAISDTLGPMPRRIIAAARDRIYHAAS